MKQAVIAALGGAVMAGISMPSFAGQDISSADNSASRLEGFFNDTSVMDECFAALATHITNGTAGRSEDGVLQHVMHHPRPGIDKALCQFSLNFWTAYGETRGTDNVHIKAGNDANGAWLQVSANGHGEQPEKLELGAEAPDNVFEDSGPYQYALNMRYRQQSRRAFDERTVIATSDNDAAIEQAIEQGKDAHMQGWRVLREQLRVQARVAFSRPLHRSAATPN